MKLPTVINQFLRDTQGASMVEYGVSLFVVTAIGITLLNGLGDATADNVRAACTAVSGTC